jgi:hypothetical protein
VLSLLHRKGTENNLIFKFVLIPRPRRNFGYFCTKINYVTFPFDYIRNKALGNFSTLNKEYIIKKYRH